MVVRTITKKNKIELERISDDELLKVRICDLPIQIKGTWLEECIDQLNSELALKGLNFIPQCYLADEWLTPEKETCIGIPFYLAHPALIRLEKKHMMEAEGEGRQWCMKLLRHEAGHAMCYAYNFHKRKGWQRLFGPSSMDYNDTYKYRPYSKNYVRHLDGFYAQYHPDEDFVETFAVWLTPSLDWKQKYQGWKALSKLKYVDKLMREIKGKGPYVKSSQKFWRLSTLRISMENYYKRKRHYWAEEFPDFHDSFLKKHFVEKNGDHKEYLRGIDVISKHKRQIVNMVASHSGEKKYVINDLIKNIQKRSRQLKLVTEDDEANVTLNLSAYITSLIMNYQYTGRFRGGNKKKK